MLVPNVVVLLDVGTRPSPTSLYRLWKTFDINSNVAGACGEIAVHKGDKWRLLLNPLVAAQVSGLRSKIEAKPSLEFRVQDGKYH